MINKSEAQIMQSWKTSLTEPLVSIVCVTYNHEKFIGEALDGFLQQQTDFAFEILIGEDCSTDATAAIIAAYRQRYPKIIKLLPSEKNLGASQNFTRSVLAATSRYIAYCEGDDFWTNSRKLQLQIDFLERHPRCSLVCHQVEVLNQTVAYAPILIPYEKFAGGRFTTRNILMGHFIPTPGMVFRTSALRLPDWFSSCRSGDIALALLLSLAGYGWMFTEKMAVYRQHDDGITKKGRLPHTEALEGKMWLFKAFDKHTNGAFSAYVNFRLAKLMLIYSVGRFKAVDCAALLSSLLKTLLFLWCGVMAAIQQNSLTTEAERH